MVLVVVDRELGEVREFLRTAMMDCRPNFPAGKMPTPGAPSAELEQTAAAL
jgi:hypothetical protein